LQFANKLDTRY